MSKASRKLAKMAKATQGAESRIVQSVQKYGRVAHRALGILFAKGKFHVKNATIGLPPISKKWKKRKKSLGMSTRSGKASGATIKAAKSPSSFIKNKQGFSISWPRANFVARSPRPGYGPTRVNRYFRFFNKQQAGGHLGKLKPATVRNIIKKATNDERKRLRKRIPGAKLRGDQLRVTVKIEGVKLKVGGVR